MNMANWFTSRGGLLERLGMSYSVTPDQEFQLGIFFLDSKLHHHQTSASIAAIVVR